MVTVTNEVFHRLLLRRNAEDSISRSEIVVQFVEAVSCLRP